MDDEVSDGPGGSCEVEHLSEVTNGKEEVARESTETVREREMGDKKHLDCGHGHQK